MQEVENLFKNKTPFSLFSTWDDLYNRFEIKGFIYKTKKIKNGSTINIYCINDLFERVKPFVAYFISTLNTTTLPGYQYFNSVFDININIIFFNFVFQISIVKIFFDFSKKNLQIF